MTAAAFETRIPAYRERLAQGLDQRLPPATTYPARLHEAMRYACQGGKRLRALLVYAAGETLGLLPEDLDAPACAVELIHAYSLVHDDLPAMDDDDLRRGQPTVHKAFDEATAILVGDALQTLAFTTLAKAATPADAGRWLRTIELLAHAAGSRGMAGGQAIDLESEGRDLSLAELESLHVHKTGALIRCCLQMACALAPAATEQEQQALDQYGKAIGLAFQIQDDVLDIESSSELLGKTAGKDEAAFKSTYPSVMGLPAAKRRAEELFEQARSALAPLGDRAAPLLWLALHIEGRRS